MPNIPGYTITQLVHEGAETLLYRARRDADRALVAIKLPRGDHPSPWLLARLRHEHAIASNLRVDGVVVVHDLVKVGNSVALVMEDFGGRPLHDVARKRSLDLPSLLRIAINLAAGLAAIHQRGILHKDIKPQNILYCEETGVVKIADFGIAERLSQEKRHAEGAAQLEGTLLYISPEQTGRMNRAVDRRSDLYSLGATLYELLSGAPPFQAADAMELVHSHIARVPTPLHARVSGIPEQVSAVVMKLLAKAPEDRYQGALGLQIDLEECLSRWETSGRVDPFPLGQRDVGDLRIPEKLYGRELESELLLGAFERARGGSAEVVLVSGGAGAGKSFLVSEVGKIFIERGGYFVSARFDRSSQGAPYAPVARALHELVRKLLAEPAATLDRFRDKLHAAVGPNGQILIDLVPDLELILGPQRAAPALGVTESQNRFDLLLQGFIRLFERPLALFFDDLQNADAASLSVLRALLTDPDKPRLLIIGAYRDQEVADGHALVKLLAELRAHGVAPGEILLPFLDWAAVRRLIMDTLQSDTSTAGSLTDLIHTKTHGNPFFLKQLLWKIQLEGLLSFDAREKRWTWDASRIEAAEVDDDVAEVIAAQITGFAERTQQALEVAACMGLEFDPRKLASIRGVSPQIASADLWEALEEGLVVPASTEQAAMTNAPAEGATKPRGANDVSYRFVHDRVRQAAYARVDEARRQELHLKIGRVIQADLQGNPPDERLFEIVNHKNVGAALIDDMAERSELARWNLAAGRKAKARAAYGPAGDYLKAGISLLPPSAWEEGYELAFDLHLEQAECDILEGRLEDAEAHFELLSVRARSRADRGRACEQRVNLYCLLGRFADALRVTRAALAELGIELPEGEQDIMAALGKASAEAQVVLGARRVEDLADAPPLTDPDVRAAIRLLVAVNSAAYLENALLSAFVNIVRTILCVKHGRSEMDPFIYATYGFFLHGSERYDEARTFWELASKLNERGGPLDLQGKTDNVLAVFAHFWKSLRETLHHALRAYERNVQCGDFVFAAYAANTAVIIRLAAGDPLDSIRTEAERYLAFMRRTKEVMSVQVQTVARQLVAGLMGRTRDPRCFDDDTCNEAELAANIEASGIPFVSCWYHTAKLVLAVFAEDYAGARASADEAERRRGGALGIQFIYEMPLYAGVALAALHAGATSEEKARIMAKLAEHRAALARWAEICPASYGAQSLLLAAEVARVSGEGAVARELYDQAIAAARAEEMLHIEALASESCAKFYLERKQDKLAAVYLKDAHHAYLLWGAARKAAVLLARYPELLMPAAPGDRPAADATTTSTTSTTGGTGGRLDTLALIRAAQAIAGELVLGALVEKLLRSAVESAGARRGVLLLARDGDLQVVAKLAVDPDRLETNLSIPAAECDDIATSVVQLVARTKSAIVVGDALRDIRFTGDPYFARTRAKSVLCLSMLQKNHVTGVLYLENDVVGEAFTPDRVELCGLFASQASIAVENAHLVEDIQRRTEALAVANEDLARQLLERAALQQDLLRVQTPIIPITDRVMVMPLIGTIDAARAQQILDTALGGVQARQVEAVILDITGVAHIGDEIVGTLMNTAHALRLLGAQAIITGIRPAVARALIDHGVDLGSLVTRSTLQAGVAYAIGRPGMRGAQGKPCKR